MYLEYAKSRYSENDKKLLTVKQYSEDEVKENRRIFRVSRRKWRFVAVLPTIISYCVGRYFSSQIITLGDTYDMATYFAYLATIVIVFMWVLMELRAVGLYRIAGYRYYIALIVLQKMSVECVGGGKHKRWFYPIKGKDVTSGYICRQYVSWSEYRKAECGSVIKINVKEELL